MCPERWGGVKQVRGCQWDGKEWWGQGDWDIERNKVCEGSGERPHEVFGSGESIVVPACGVCGREKKAEDWEGSRVQSRTEVVVARWTIAPDLNVYHTVLFSVLFLCFCVNILSSLLDLNFFKNHVLFIFVSPKLDRYVFRVWTEGFVKLDVNRLSVDESGQRMQKKRKSKCRFQSLGMERPWPHNRKFH